MNANMYEKYIIIKMLVFKVKTVSSYYLQNFIEVVNEM